MEKILNSRVIMKHDVASNWEKATNFSPLAGEIIIYDKDSNYNYERMKIGDGETNVNDLPFIDKENIKYADVSLQQWYEEGIMYAENGSSLNIDGLYVSCAPNNDNLIINYTGYIRIKDNMYDAGNNLIVDGVNYPGVYEGEVKSSISLWGTVGVWTFEYFQIDQLDTFVSADYVNEKVNEKAEEINTTLDEEIENLNTKIDAVNDRVDDILYEDISLQELLDNGQLTGTDWGGQTVTPSVYDLTVSGIDTLTINYNGYIEFKVNYGPTQNAVSIDGVTIETPMEDTTEFKGYVNSYISIYCTVMSATFEYIRTLKENEASGDMLKSVYDADGNGVVDSAEKLATARTISLSGAVDETPVTFDGSQDVNIVVNGIRESYLTWGNKDFSNDMGIIDTLLNENTGHNHLAHMNPDDISIEYSKDGGSSWLDYGASNGNKIDLVTNTFAANLGGSSPSYSVNDKLRVTISTRTGGNLYFTLHKAMIEIAANGNSDCSVLVETSKVGSDNTFTTYKDLPIAGSTGWNVIQMSGGYFGSALDTQTSNIRKVRFTFSIGTAAANKAMVVRKIRMYGERSYQLPSNLAKTGHLYTYDASQNATFPAEVTATKFNGVATTAATADKLTTARGITITGAVNSTRTVFDGSYGIDIPINSVKETYLQWGGKDITGDVSPLDSVSLPELSGNRLAFLRPQDIQVEYSRDGGATWLDYGMSDENKVKLVTTEGSARVGNTTSGVTPDYQVRITLTAAADYLYFTPIKALIRISSDGAQDCWVTAERAYIGSETNFVAYKTKVPIRGWSGWNSIVMSGSFGGTETQTSNIRKWRFTFGMTSLHSNTSYTNALNITRLYMIGTSVHKSLNNLAKSGHLYSYDWQQNATFPASVNATNLLVNGVNIADTYATQEVVNQLLARIEALEAQVSEANAILETI